jgi:predicted nucleic acid-binding protein
MPATYLDSSAIVKLAVAEPESVALRRYLRRRQPIVSSALARTEVLRALLLEGEAGVARGRAVLARLDLIRVNDDILNAAGVLLPPQIRSLDAVHLATAHRLGADLAQLVTYDARMVETARLLHLKTASPT